MNFIIYEDAVKIICKAMKNDKKVNVLMKTFVPCLKKYKNLIE